MLDPDCLEGGIILIKKLISQPSQHAHGSVNYRESSSRGLHCAQPDSRGQAGWVEGAGEQQNGPSQVVRPQLQVEWQSPQGHHGTAPTLLPQSPPTATHSPWRKWTIYQGQQAQTTASRTTESPGPQIPRAQGAKTHRTKTSFFVSWGTAHWDPSQAGTGVK